MMQTWPQKETRLGLSMHHQNIQNFELFKRGISILGFYLIQNIYQKKESTTLINELTWFIFSFFSPSIMEFWTRRKVTLYTF